MIWKQSIQSSTKPVVFKFTELNKKIWNSRNELHNQLLHIDMFLTINEVAKDVPNKWRRSSIICMSLDK